MSATPGPLPLPPPGRPPRIAFLIASFFGSGRSPFAPGTAGTAASLLLYLPLALWAGPVAYVVVTLGVLAAGIWAAQRVSESLEIEDPGVVVIDETVGLLVTMTFIVPSVGSVLLGFLVFRVLDVLKPFGIRRLERLPGGVGIMMDDFAAGVVGNLILRLLLDLPRALSGPAA